MAELADAPDLGSGGETHGGSSPPFRTNRPFKNLPLDWWLLGKMGDLGNRWRKSGMVPICRSLGDN